MENNNQNQADPLAALQPDAGWKPDTARGLARLRAQRSRRSHRRRRAAAVLAVGLATGLGLLALPAPRAYAQRQFAAVCSGPMVLIHQALVDFHHDADISRLHLQMVGIVRILLSSFKGNVDLPGETERRIAPDFTLTDASGKAVRLSDYKGKVVLLNFWATWCPPCQEETPWFVRFQERYRDRDFVVLGVSLDEDGWKSVQPFMEAHKMNYPVMLGNPEVAGLYRVKNLPETFIIDQSGRIAVDCTGLIGALEYKTAIEGLLKGGVL